MSLLAETGIVGFLLYGWMIVAVVQSLWKSSKSPDSLGHTWMLLIAVFLFAGLTGDLQFNKLLWIIIGIPGPNTFIPISPEKNTPPVDHTPFPASANQPNRMKDE